MKKVYRKSQKKDVLGRWIGGLFMHKYGLPYRNAAGHIFPKDVELVEQMLDAVQKYPEIHVVTVLKNGWMVNRYQTENASCHYLYTGDADPNIEFTNEFTLDDFTEDEIAASEKFDEEFSTHEFTPTEITAINYSLHLWLIRTND